MDINDFKLFDFSEMLQPEKQEMGGVKLYAKEKSMYLSYASYCVIAVTMIVFALVLIFKLPHNNVLWWGVPVYLYTVAHISTFVLCRKNRKKLKISAETKEYNNIATALFVLSFMLSISLSLIFIGRAINPNFMIAL